MKSKKLPDISLKAFFVLVNIKNSRTGEICSIRGPIAQALEDRNLVRCRIDFQHWLTDKGEKMVHCTPWSKTEAFIRSNLVKIQKNPFHKLSTNVSNALFCGKYVTGKLVRIYRLTAAGAKRVAKGR